MILKHLSLIMMHHGWKTCCFTTLTQTGAIDSIFLSVQGFDLEDAEASMEPLGLWIESGSVFLGFD
jgi:hypothetical protein